MTGDPRDNGYKQGERESKSERRNVNVRSQVYILSHPGIHYPVEIVLRTSDDGPLNTGTLPWEWGLHDPYPGSQKGTKDERITDSLQSPVVELHISMFLSPYVPTEGRSVSSKIDLVNKSPKNDPRVRTYTYIHISIRFCTCLHTYTY